MTVKQVIEMLKTMPDDSVKFCYRHPDGEPIEASFIDVDEVTGFVVAD
jgi:hypothetical protein